MDNPAVVRAWCTVLVRAGDGSTNLVSHGICVDCALTFLKRLPPAYLATVADADGTVSLFSGHRFQVTAPARQS